MKHPLPRLILLGLLATACNKHNNAPTPPTRADSTHTYTINLSYPDSSQTPATDWELIITEPGGKRLLDTIVPINVNVRSTITTTATVVNITSVEMGPKDTAFRVIMLAGIHPNAIPTPVPIAAISPQRVGPTVIRLANFWNTPSHDLQHPIYYSQDIFLGADWAQTGTIGRRVNNSVLVTWPSKGLYHFYPWRSVAADTFDLALLTDTAATLNLTTHAGYSRPNVFLEGIMDTTDFSKTIFLYNYVYNIYNSVASDIVYPPKNVQKYDMRATYNGNDSTQVTVYSYGNTLTADHPWMDTTNFSLLSTQQDSFAVTFKNIALLYYETQWKASGMNFFVYSSPDSTSRRPLTLFNSLHSSKLQSLNISTLSPVYLYLFTAPGFANYADFMTYDCDPVQYQARRVTGYTYLGRKF
jgi:hypothetical protein